MDTFVSNSLVNENETKWEDLHKKSSLKETRTTPSYAIRRIFSERNMIETSGTCSNTNTLEIGCGFGRNLLYLLENKFSGKYVGIDQTDISISKTSSLLNNYINHGIVKILKENAGEQLPFSDESFDCVFDIMSAITFIPDEDLRLRYFDNICRLLKPGGIYFFLCVRTEGFFKDKILDPNLGDESLFKRKFDNMIEKSYTSDELERYLHKLSLKKLDVVSEHIRAFGDENFERENGFWFGCFMKG
ncbi:class I SAM-dependent methyltransferase [Salmonella enterica]|uniref:Phthiotriol/phenolphthiotriol dimycocerosates methyltransferase n=6 Tax=Salmonella enterica TaxID=28901 RepID=A0A447RAR4_SALER|nr:class I SAM-dependent methyltransferase [Salmonella enterica]EAA4454009.1 class I SAM-dependent methyltransferase [Salmonella enterica subsp. diarizonae]EAW1161677.1 class I SAM-dependent methyltransferase [Salmonella enterica subsp. enterica]EBP3746075.1 class I SAM-dependent methyltransferase [Salmonella enterica subsp. arizonae]ECS6772040.1 class I SAM-dependent methyltransferase [Salmonella enterica subsp. diarizonae serovar 65:z10:e,n,x,z15]EDN4535418.1 class I SAM-dependent methyltran